jgi:hypothetical protein
MKLHATPEESPHVANKKAGRPKGTNNRGVGVHVRLDPDVVGQAKVVIGRKNLKLGDYLSSLLKGPVGRAYQDVLGELTAESEKAKTSKR